ncbi:MAG: lipocalin family protein [Planctomycetia bacterium]|nr:lipocalin family protein [Planctomycetia bacterium]
MPPLLQSLLFSSRRRIKDGSRKRRGSSAAGTSGIERLESRAMLAADDVLVGFVGNRVMLTLDSEGAAITNLATAYDAAAKRLTITAATAGTLSMAAPVNGIFVDDVADTITVDLKKITKFAGLSILGGVGTDTVTIGRGGVNLAAVGRGAAAQGFTIDTGLGAGDAIVVGGQITTKGAGAVSLSTKGEAVARGILLAAGVTTPGGSQTFAGPVTLLNGVALQAGGGISFSSTIDGFGRLRLSAARAITMAGDIGSRLPLQGITVAQASRVLVGAGLVLDGSGTAAGESGFVIGGNVRNVVFSSVPAIRTIGGFGGAGLRFVGGSTGSRITGVTSTGNGIGVQIGPGAYTGTWITGSSFSGNSGNGVSLQAARGVRIGALAAGAGNSIVSNGGYGITASGVCAGSSIVGNEIGDNAFGQVENYLASTLSGNQLIQNGTGLVLQLTDVGRAAYRAQKARRYSFDVSVEAFVVSARSTGWLDTRTAVLDIDASVGFMVPPPGLVIPPAMQRMMLGENRLATSLTPFKTLPGIEFAKSVQYVGSDSYGRHYRAVVGLSTFAGMIPLADLQAAPSIGRDGIPVPVDVWVNAQGNVSRIAGVFTGGAFTMSLRGQGAAGFVPAMPQAQTVGTSAANARSVPAAVGILGSADPYLPGTTNGVSGVQVGSSTLAIPYGDGVVAPADWYFPTQVDGTIDAQGVIWLQHAPGTTGGALAALAVDLAWQTNSIVVAPSLPTGMNWSLAGDAAVRAVASLFEGDRSALAASAAAAGYVGEAGALSGKFVLAGHSAGGGFVTAVAADYAAHNPTSAHLVGVIMYDGVSRGAFDGSGSFATQVAELDSRSIPVYQLAAPAQLWNAYGATTNALVSLNPGRFRGVVLTGGSHVDAIVGSNPSDAIVAQRVTTESLPGNAAAARLLTAGWINDLYVGAAPDAGQYGFYAPANHPILLGDAAATPLPSPVANMWSPAEWRLGDELAALGGPSGFDPGPAVNSGDNGLSVAVTPPNSNSVTGVKTGTSSLAIPCGPRGYVTSAEWYFPTQADGRVSANGVIWLQRGELRDAAAFAALAIRIAGQTNSIVVAPTISSFEIPTLPGLFLGSVAMQQAVAGMMLGDRGALTVSATAAGYQGTLPAKILLAGQRTGGGFAAEVGALTVDNGAAANLLGVVMFDGVANPDEFATVVEKLDSLGIPIYQIASAPQAANDWGRTTEQLAALHPDEFVGVQLDDGTALDAVITLATGWINDFYSGVYGASNPFYGIYGSPNDGTYQENQPIVMGGTGATTLPAPPPVDINQYAGKWYEQGSVKPSPATGLVNVASVFTPQQDGTIKVENSGSYGPGGPAWNVTGSAVPVNAFNTRLNVSFSGSPTMDEPGNYWILDYAPDYSWAIVSDPTGSSGTILTRDQVIPEGEYNALVARAYRLGVKRTITPTAQYPAVS